MPSFHEGMRYQGHVHDHNVQNAISQYKENHPKNPIHLLWFFLPFFVSFTPAFSGGSFLSNIGCSLLVFSIFFSIAMVNFFEARKRLIKYEVNLESINLWE